MKTRSCTCQKAKTTNEWNWKVIRRGAGCNFHFGLFLDLNCLKG